MPCYDPETHNRPIRLESKVHALTELLCSTCQRLESLHPDFINSDDKLNLWWTKHKAHDDRVAAAKLKRDKFGQASLSPEENGLLYFERDISVRD